MDTHWKRNDTLPVASQQFTGIAAAAKSSISTNVSVLAASRLINEAKAAAAATTTTSHLVADAVKKCGLRPGTVSSLFTKKTVTAAAAEKITVAHSTRQLAQNVEDIDAQDRDNPFLMSEYVVDIYNYLQQLETRYAIRDGFLDKHEEISPRMRSVLIDWINEVHFQFKLLAETYFMAIGLIDRYLQLDRHVARRNLQLVGATALFVAAKYEELYPPVLADFVYITDNTYTEAQVIEMEKRMLSTLKFELCPPVAIQFLRRYSKAAVSAPVTHTMAKYLIELCTIDYGMCQHAASLVS